MALLTDLKTSGIPRGTYATKNLHPPASQQPTHISVFINITLSDNSYPFEKKIYGRFMLNILFLSGCFNIWLSDVWYFHIDKEGTENSEAL